MASQENIAEVNEALNALYVEEEDYDALRASINKCAATAVACCAQLHLAVSVVFVGRIALCATSK